MDDYVFTASWIPVTKQMPPIGADVIVSTKRSVNRAWWDGDVWHMASHGGEVREDRPGMDAVAKKI